jgi:hypothetical protein
MLDCVHDRANGMVDIGIGRGVAETHPQRSLAPSTLDPHRGKDV